MEFMCLDYLLTKQFLPGGGGLRGEREGLGTDSGGGGGGGRGDQCLPDRVNNK